MATKRPQTPRRATSAPDPLAGFHPAVQAWFRGAFRAPTAAQVRAWPEILAGRSTLLSAPTGSGKTLAAFLAAIQRLMFAPVPPTARRCRILYVSPLKALAVDVERNLHAPLAGIAREASALGAAFHRPDIAVRSGDTPADERRLMARRPPDILITTPESLFLLLTSQARSLLAAVEVVILDEIHVLVGTKRGAHLAVSVERVAELAGGDPQRIGLSATQRPLAVVARYLVGGVGSPWRRRPVRVVDAGAAKAYALTVEVPLADVSPAAPVSGGRPARRSIWPAIHPRLLELVRAHRSTILFVNARRLAERLAAALNDLAGEELVRAHHGSLAREERLHVEAQLKDGQVRGLVATSTLELGIDMGAVDLVLQVETPPSVASAVQRIGRASHQAGAVSRGIFFPKYRGDLLATAAITRAVQDGDIEPIRLLRNPLDVLPQQLVSMVAQGERSVDELHALVRRAAPFAALTRPQIEGLLDLLSGRYPSSQFAALRPHLVWDRRRGTVRPREGSRALAVANAGTIPDRGLYGVFLADGEASHVHPARRGGRRVGELDEEMVFECRLGDVFVLGATSWRILEITRDRVLVAPAPGQPGRMPFWRADRPPRPIELGRAIGRLTRELAALPRAAATARLIRDHALDAQAAENLLAYLAEQRQATRALPDDRTLVLERFRDEMGDWRLCLLSPFGGRVHAPLMLALLARLRRAGTPEAEALWSDDGIVLRLPDQDRPPAIEMLLPEPEAIEDLVQGELGGSALFASHFREAAARALLLPRRRPGQRTPLWMQRKRAADLLQVAAHYPDFPILLETYRECLQDVFDLPALRDLLERVRRRQIRPVTVDTAAPSPFAAALLFGYVGNYLYDGDAPLAERRAHALAVDQRLLRELLGDAELRELLDPSMLAAVERALQGLEADRRAGGADRLHDLLLRLGDLSNDEVAARVAPEPGQGADHGAALLIRKLVEGGRAVWVEVGEEKRLIAAEEAGCYRDALGSMPPAGLPAAFLEPRPDPLLDLLDRYARTHGPFRTAEAAARYALPEPVVAAHLQRLAQTRRLLEGEFRPGGRGHEWCDAEVLASVRRRSLAKLRREVEPVEPAGLARLLLDWHGVRPADAPPDLRGPGGLLDSIERLQGAAIPASILETDVLPARIPEYRPGDLDLLLAGGEVLWGGIGPLGERDGKIGLYLAEDLSLLRRPVEDGPAGSLHVRLRELLRARGASFFSEIRAAIAGLQEHLQEALWDLVWAGEVTNDSFAALRARIRPPAASRQRSRLLAYSRGGGQHLPALAGRWSLLRRLDDGDGPSPAERLMAQAGQLLGRHGILTRDAVAFEGVPGGFAALYPALSAMESHGRIRRGYFVAGLGGSQFADPEALDRLRSLRGVPAETGAGIVLAAADPANPYGAALPWPATLGRLARVAGTHVVLVDGRLVASLSRDAAEITASLPEHEPDRTRTGRAAAAALAAWARRTLRPTLGWRNPGPTPLGPHLLAAGFFATGTGFRLG